MAPPDRGRRRNRVFLVVVLILAAIVVAGIAIARRTRPVLIAGPMVQIPERDGLAIIWDMRAFFSRGAVRLVGSDGRAIVAPAMIREDGSYEATFQRLAPAGKYSYTVLDYGFLGRELAVAGPFEADLPFPRGRSFRFAVFGDSGMGNNAQEAIAEEVAAHKPDVVIHVGDLVYPSGERTDYLAKFFQPYAELIRRVPFMPVLGNHDCIAEKGRPFLDTFDLPRNGPPGIEPERCYWFDFGDARFVALDSNKVEDVQGAVLAREQMKAVIAPWLREVLTNCDARWKFVYFHHPLYTGSTHPATGGAYLKEAYVDIFEDCGVNIVFVGHNHLFERTAPIRGDKVEEDGRGVVYITTGAGGAARYPEDQSPPEYIRMHNDRALSFTRVDVTADRLELQQIDDHGKVFDRYVLVKARSEPKPEAGSRAP